MNSNKNKPREGVRDKCNDKDGDKDENKGWKELG